MCEHGQRVLRAAGILGVAVFCTVALWGGESRADDPTGQQQRTGGVTQHLLYPRTGYTATVLPDGTIAVIGGRAADGKIVTPIEIIDPQTAETRVVSDSGVTPRSGQTATLLTTGEVLLAGGVGADGKALSNVELWNPETTKVQVTAGLATPRSGAHASLLPDGEVLISGGRDATGQVTAIAELYDPESHVFTSVDATAAYPVPGTSPRAASVMAVLPSADANDVAVDGRIAIRLSAPLGADTAVNQAVAVIGPGGAVAGKAVAAEDGRLLFFTPGTDLLPQATYTVFVQGAVDRDGRSFPFTTSSFTTRSFDANPMTVTLPALKANGGAAGRQAVVTPAPVPAAAAAVTATTQAPTAAQRASSRKEQEPPAADEDTAAEDWVPQEKNRHGEWRVLGLTGDPKLNTGGTGSSALVAPEGQTAVAGRVLRYHGKPLAGVTVSIAGQSALTDSAGRFLLTGVSPGITQLKVDGSAVWMHGRHYTRHFIRVEVAAGQTTAIPNPIYLPRVDPSTEVTISSPASKEIVLTHPAIPGLEVHIPKGVVLREYDGKIVTKLSITPVPLDRPPYPTPVPFAVYFTLQPGGAFIEAAAGKAIRVIYPNYQNLAPGTRANFWNYDPGTGWQVYGQGTVTSNGKQVVPDANVGFRQIISFGMGIDKGEGEPAKASAVAGCVGGGDPVDCATGLFLHTVTDLTIKDTIPIRVTRTYRQGDPTSRAFGVGANLSYNMFLYNGSGQAFSSQIDLVLSDGSRVPYVLQSGTGLSNAVWIHTSTPSIFYGSILTPFNGSGGEGFMITLRDRTVLKFATHSPNGLLSITDPNGNALTFTVTNSSVGGQITRVTSPSGRYVQFSYDSGGRIIQAADNAGRTVSYTYDQATYRLMSVRDQNNQTESYTYDSDGEMLTVTDKRHNVMVTNEYTSGRVSKQTLADGAIWLFAYDTDAGLPRTTVTDPNGSIRQDTFNRNGYLIKEILAAGKAEQQTFIIQRDAANLALSVTDALGRVTHIAHDGFGNVTAVTRLAGTVNAVTDSFAYDPASQKLSSHTDPLGHTTTFGYDWLGNLTSLTDPLGASVHVTNDAQGKPTSIASALNKTTQIVYDQGDVAAVIDPLGRTVSIFHDALGRPVGITDAAGRNVRFDYDPMDRLQRTTDALGGITALTYDALGNVLTVSDARNVGTHTYTYDARNRVHTYTDPLGHVETYGYDGMGNLTSKVDRKNQTTSYTYDGLNRLKTITYADSSSITLTWDAGNRATAFVDTLNGTISRQYDGLDRLTEESGPQGQVDYTYDAAGRRTQLTVTGLAAVTYQYDNANRLTQVAQGSVAVGLSYDAANRRTGVTLPNGIAATYTFDDADQLLTLSYDSGGTHVGDLSYTYDSSGRRIGEQGSLGKLTIPTTVATTTYDAANRLTNWGSSSLNYDNNGNMTASGSAGYGWNARNQLVSTSDGSGAFTYDAFGRRTSRTVSGATTPYLHDGLNPATVAGTFMLDGLGLDETYAQVASGAVTSRLTDALGSTVALANGAGSLTANYTYGPYGAGSSTGSATTPFRFTGREADDGTNLYYYRARYYNPQLGRFIAQDPLGLGGGINTYAYAGGNPVSVLDPYGLFCIPDAAIEGVAGLVGGAVGGAIPGLLTLNPELALGGAVMGGVAGGLGGVAGALAGSTARGYATAIAVGASAPGGFGALATGAYGGALGYAISTEMQQSGYSAAAANFAGGTVGGAAAGGMAAFFAGELIGRGTFLGAIAGAAGAATSNAVSGYLHIINSTFGDCGCH